MIEYADIHGVDIIATRVSGKITEPEFDALKNEISGKIKLYDKVNWYFEMDNFTGWDWSAFWTDIKFSIKNSSNFGRVAFVGESLLENLMAQFTKLFTPAEVKYFNIESKEEAKEWIKYGIIRK